MDGYDQMLAFLGVVLVAATVALLMMARQGQRLEASIQRHEAMLAEQRAREAAGLHAAE